jgi:hypothetical protein
MKSASHPVVAAFDATTPTHTTFGIDSLSAIQPVAVSRALQCVYAGLVDGVRMVRNSHKHVVSSSGAISNATSHVTAMVRSSVPGISPVAARFVLHYVVVTRAKRSQVAAQNICRSSRHQNPRKNGVIADPKRKLYGSRGTTKRTKTMMSSNPKRYCAIWNNAKVFPQLMHCAGRSCLPDPP